MKNSKAQARAKQQKTEKSAKAGVVILMCLVALCLCGAVGVGAFTDVFRQESEVKAVALVLSGAEEQELENQLAKLYPLVRDGVTGKTFRAKELLSQIKPYAKDGLYAANGYEAPEPDTQADPAERFSDGEGNFSYYKVAKQQVDDILAQFEVNADHTVNTKDFYYYDGNYYFAAGDEGEAFGTVNADITSSKRIQDGRYYITCTMGDKTVYVIAGKDEASSQWKIQEISLEPVFDQLGIMIKDSNTSLFDYDIKTRVIEGKAENSAVYCRYVLEYPVFYGDTAGEQEANRFYQSMLSYYTQQAQESASQYKKYIKDGGVESLLPLEINFSAEVTYTSGAYIGVSNEISETQLIYKTEGDDEASAAAVVPSKKTVECYIFDTETGAYVTKDSIIGKNYQLIEQLLYRIYYSYDYASLLSEDVADSQQVPADTDKLGKKIYDCANTLSEDGYMFCYINDSGFREDVIIPFSADIFEISLS